jgi:asparagine synthase (glutamine-hydrolysing)
MSVQFGRWNFEGQQPPEDYIGKVGAILARYATDKDESYSKGGVTILYRAFYTTKESRREIQPHISSSGAVITWDGRLDNRAELISELRDVLSIDSPDVDIVSAAYERWHTKSFGKLIGDWALSIWNPVTRSLLFAKDPIGPRHLYYSIDLNQITWCTVLDPLIYIARRPFEISEEYVAGWLSHSPSTHLTPYVGINAVPPSSLVVVEPGNHVVSQYWDFDPARRIRYRTDSEYEEHFRAVFARAVRRRLRSDAPILAELSGGRDSCSIVCMADTLIATGVAETPRLDTVSYYDDTEPLWNERPYFTKVEEKRGRTGVHIDASPEKIEVELSLESDARGVPLIPSYSTSLRQYHTCIASQGNRVVLSGLGGDEVMGGAPIARPELQDLLAGGHFIALARQLKSWALQQRRPWFYLLFEAARGFLPPMLVGVPKLVGPVPWLRPNFVNRQRAALTGYASRVAFFGPLPSFQENMSTLKGLRRQLACKALPLEPPHEKCYPFLDRNLLEFMYAIPREQSVRPSQRRSLMRRALAGIVPDEILNKRGKAPVRRAHAVEISRYLANPRSIQRDLVSASLGIVDSTRFLAALQKVITGEEDRAVGVKRVIRLERWLRSLGAAEVIDIAPTRSFNLALEVCTQGKEAG